MTAVGASRFAAPTALLPEHDIAAFDCGNAELDHWLKNIALASEGRSARTYVVTQGHRVVAYYCLSTGAVERANLSSAKLRKGSPDPIPVLIIGRLAVDRGIQKEGIGRGLLRDAILRCLSVATSIGVRAIVIHALNDDGARYYQKLAFLPSPIHPLTLVLPIEHAKTALG